MEQHTQTASRSYIAPGDRLRAAMDRGTVGLPGAFNGLVARAVAQAGFSGAYVSGAAVTASYGVPDIGLLTLNEFCAVIRQVWLGSGLPIIADADTGFGESEMLTRTVREYERAGACGLHLEDQVFPKRCGHLDGKTLVERDHFVEKVAAAAAARDEIDGARGGGAAGRGSFIVCARTDAAGVAGIDEAIARSKAYLDAGADMIFPEGLRSEEEFGRIGEALRSYRSDAYLLANMTEFGKTPLIPLSRFEELGYHAVIWPVSTLRSAMGEVKRMLEGLRRDGHVESSLGRMLTRDELYALLGYTPGEEWRYGLGR
ncbi:MAG: isocitrate lyase/PEP mutase family protein [Phycisphaerales bacterium]